MAALSDFYPYVLPMVNGCSVILADQYIRDVCIDFCGKSLFVTRVLDPIGAIAGLADYDFEPPTDERVTMVRRAWFKGQKIEVISLASPMLRPEVFNTQFDGAKASTGSVSKLIQKDELTFTLEGVPSENSSAAITMVAATKPSRDAVTIADILFNEYAYEIGCGVVGRLMMIPKQPFTDGQMGSLMQKTYMVARNEAQLRANLSLGSGGAQVDIRRTS